MKLSLIKGYSFGLTSGVITTLGLIVGLNSSTGSKMVILGGVFTIAIADAFSDALGIHISEEAENKHTTREVWESTLSTFIAKFVFALTFAVPILLFNLSTAIQASVLWGFFVLGVISYFMAKEHKASKWYVIGEHWIIAAIVIVVTHYAGELISIWFG